MLRESAKFLFKDSTIYGLAGAISKAASILVIPILTRYISKESYGAVNVVLSSALIFEGLIILGQDSAIARFFFDVPDNIEYKRKIATIGLSIQILCFLIFLPFFIFFYSDIGSILLNKDRSLIDLWKISILALPASIFILFTQNIFKWTFKRVNYLIITLGRSVVYILLTIIFIIFLKKDCIGVIFSSVLAAYIIMLISIILIKDFINFKNLKREDIKLFYEMLKYGLPYTVSLIVVSILPSLDKLILIRYVNLEQMGEYTLALQLASALLLITSAFQIAFGPYAYSIWQKAEASKTFGQLFILYFIILTTLSLFVAVFGDIFITLLASKKYLAANIIVPFLLIAYIFQGLMEFSWLGIAWSKKTVYIPIIRIAGLIILFVLYLFFIRNFGTIGAAIALILTNIFTLLITFIISNKYYHIPVNISKTILIFCFASLSFSLICYNNYKMDGVSLILKYSSLPLFVLCIYYIVLASTEKRKIKEVIINIKERLFCFSRGNNC